MQCIEHEELNKDFIESNAHSIEHYWSMTLMDLLIRAMDLLRRADLPIGVMDLRISLQE